LFIGTEFENKTILETLVRLFSLYFETIYFLRMIVDSNAIAICGYKNRLINDLLTDKITLLMDAEIM